MMAASSPSRIRLAFQGLRTLLPPMDRGEIAGLPRGAATLAWLAAPGMPEAATGVRAPAGAEGTGTAAGTTFTRAGGGGVGGEGRTSAPADRFCSYSLSIMSKRRSIALAACSMASLPLDRAAETMGCP